MTKKVVRPILPIAPDQYDPVYINQLARALETLIDEVRDADVNFQGAGEVFAPTNVATISLGSVTVSVS